MDTKRDRPSYERHTYERGDDGDRCRECGNSRAWHPRDWR